MRATIIWQRCVVLASESADVIQDAPMIHPLAVDEEEYSRMYTQARSFPIYTRS